MTNNTFLVLRQVLLNRFKVSSPTRRSVMENVRRPHHRLHHRMRRREGSGHREAAALGSEIPEYRGHWYRVPFPEMAEDLLETEERRKERVRLLLGRYGILFRELLQRELPSLRWPDIFRALRIMELSGEVMSGIFFHGIPGLQFISPKAFRILQRRLPEEAIYWMNAADPASLCGTPLDSIRGSLPARLVSTHLVFHGKRLVMVSRRNGKDLTFHVPADDPNLSSYFLSLRHLLIRKFQALRRITIETINGEEASRSPYLPSLRLSFVVSVDYLEVTLYRKMS